ncbi:MAG: acyl-CoA dehydrogenase [Gammaproteobacteria bacterium]|nr:acyl-CoA dehydrogenase [Gammaproteobacteria bacterium]
MDFSLNDVQRMLTESVEKFIANDYPFDTRQKYAASETGFSADVWKTFAELGWTAVPFSEEDGGFDGTPVESMVLLQQFGRGLVVEPYLANVVMAGGVLKRIASSAQKTKWLQPLIAGDLQSALAYHEPQSRYDLGNVATTAVPDGDAWILNGDKGVVLNGGNAGLLIVAARSAGDSTDPDGITLFAVGGHADGVSRRRYPTVDGHQAAEISFRDVRVEGDALLGKPGQGLPVLEAVIDDAILAVSAEAVGIMQIMTDKTVEYCKSRVQFGVPIGSFQALQHRMVDMLTACEQSYSLLVWASMASAEQTDEAKRAISALKYQISTAGRKVAEEAVQLHGGMGVTWELDIAHYLKRMTTICQLFGNADWHLDKLVD